MPQCPHCQAPYENGQLYCRACGGSLAPPEPGNTVCPQCGGRISPGQESCQECNAPLKEAQAVLDSKEPEPEPEAPRPQPSNSPQTFAGLPSWLIALLAGAGMIIIILLILLFSRGISTPPAPLPAPNASEAPAPAPAADLRVRLQNVLATLRQAQMHKDIVKFMSVYSPTFPGLENKRANTLKSWERYDFTNLVFTVDQIQTITSDNAAAWVTWYIDTRDRRSQELNSSTQTYKVQFAREEGKWRIRALEEVKP
jgi:hypothetical protein